MYTKICPQCNNQFSTKHKHTIHCSPKCNGESRRTHNFNKICKHCGKEYTSRHKESKFCCKDCQSKANMNSTLVKCAICDKDILRSKYWTEKQTKHFCSRECYLEDHKSKNINLSEDKQRKHCSYHRVGKRDAVLTCRVCKVEFCSIQYRKSNNEKGFSIIRPFKHTCSSKCLTEFYKTDEKRKEKISFAFSGEKHPNYVNGASYNGRIRKTDLKENFGDRDKRELMDKFGNKCFKCGSNKYLSIDHHVPFSRGGKLTFTNSVVLCRSCNSRKNAKMPSDFYTEKEIKKLELMGIHEQSLFSYM